MNRGESGTLQVRRGDGGSERSRVTTDEMFDVLKNERRRAVLRYLIEHEGCGELSDVAEHIAAAENDTTIQQLSSQERKRVRIALYQCHLPKMDSLQLVEYNKPRGTIELREAASEFEPYLDLDRTHVRGSLSSSRGVIAFAVGVVTLVTAGTLGLGPLSAVPPTWWTLLSVLAVVGLAARDYWTARGATERRVALD
ncbi:DUF7344 domain-containing protein [Halorubrum sp. DTA46]|uniref:DUF7344 domain-containing protein n=1 Tax=Halorubrum sp. DTA46 TaxID=3402162 RepID=UPI003AAE57F3